MGEKAPKDRHLKEIVDRSQFWDAEDLMRNLDREIAQLEHGMDHMIWDLQDRHVTTPLRPLPITPNFQFVEDAKEFRLTVRLPGVSREDIRLNVGRDSVEVLACSGDFVCKPYYISMDVSGELVPDTADARFSGDVLEFSVKKVVKKKLEIK